MTSHEKIFSNKWERDFGFTLLAVFCLITFLFSHSVSAESRIDWRKVSLPKGWTNLPDQRYLFFATSLDPSLNQGIGVERLRLTRDRASWIAKIHSQPNSVGVFGFLKAEAREGKNLRLWIQDEQKNVYVQDWITSPTAIWLVQSPEPKDVAISIREQIVRLIEKST